MFLRKRHVHEAILKRRSVRTFKSDEIPRKTLFDLLFIAQNSPSARNIQPYYIRVVTNGELLSEMHKDYETFLGGELPAFIEDGKTFYHNSPAFILIYTDDNAGYSKVDAGIVTANVANAAYASGLGSCIVGCVHDFLTSDSGREKWNKKLHIPESYSFCIGIALGFADETPKMKNRELNRILFME